ncbi:Hypothetical protein FKW44_021028 [Caligus rogercresseyi]|uniref:Uncharacterized protein n=1 Tax=Caligus rogercresseyi TaxID=217165 RepID=A0A7T8GQT2_CALRO|nr:Hypothetical protein FKW44_021028 [Caligus rogercresseyi]
MTKLFPVSTICSNHSSKSLDHTSASIMHNLLWNLVAGSLSCGHQLVLIGPLFSLDLPVHHPYMARSRGLQSGDKRGQSFLLQKW